MEIFVYANATQSQQEYLSYYFFLACRIRIVSLVNAYKEIHDSDFAGKKIDRKHTGYCLSVAKKSRMNRLKAKVVATINFVNVIIINNGCIFFALLSYSMFVLIIVLYRMVWKKEIPFGANYIVGNPRFWRDTKTSTTKNGVKTNV